MAISPQKQASKFTLIQQPTSSKEMMSMNLRKRKVTFSDFQMLDSDEIEEELEKEEGVTKKKSASMKVKD